MPGRCGKRRDRRAASRFRRRRRRGGGEDGGRAYGGGYCWSCSRSGWRTTSCRSAWYSWKSFPAIPWARCRKTCSGMSIAGFLLELVPANIPSSLPSPCPSPPGRGNALNCARSVQRPSPLPGGEGWVRGGSVVHRETFPHTRGYDAPELAPITPYTCAVPAWRSGCGAPRPGRRRCAASGSRHNRRAARNRRKCRPRHAPGSPSRSPCRPCSAPRP